MTAEAREVPAKAAMRWSSAPSPMTAKPWANRFAATSLRARPSLNASDDRVRGPLVNCVGGFVGDSLGICKITDQDAQGQRVTGGGPRARQASG